jgi:hypothetical protein
LGIWIIRLENRNFDAFDLTSNYIKKNVNLKSPILDRVLDTMKTKKFNYSNISRVTTMTSQIDGFLIHLMKILLQLPNYQLRLTTNC